MECLKNADKEEDWRRTIGIDYKLKRKMVDLISAISIITLNAYRLNSNQKVETVSLDKKKEKLIYVVYKRGIWNIKTQLGWK